MNLKHLGLLLVLLVVALVAIAVGQRLPAPRAVPVRSTGRPADCVAGRPGSTEAAVVVGVVCGVGASIPVSLGLLLALGWLPSLRSETPPARPTVVLVGMAQPTQPGTFRIIGEDPEGRLLHD
jgi:hypothetical protein